MPRKDLFSMHLSWQLLLVMWALFIRQYRLKCFYQYFLNVCVGSIVVNFILGLYMRITDNSCIRFRSIIC